MKLSHPYNTTGLIPLTLLALMSHLCHRSLEVLLERAQPLEGLLCLGLLLLPQGMKRS